MRSELAMATANRVRVRIDAETCVGSGTCAMVDPDHFQLVDGKGRDAVLDCPVQAIVREPA
jgi:ferredoxin